MVNISESFAHSNSEHTTPTFSLKSAKTDLQHLSRSAQANGTFSWLHAAGKPSRHELIWSILAVAKSKLFGITHA